MNLLSNSQALAHDECVCQQNKSPNTNFGMRQNGIVSYGDFGLAAWTQEIPIWCSWFAHHLIHFLQTFAAVGLIVQNTVLLQKSHCRFRGLHLVTQRNEIVGRASLWHFEAETETLQTFFLILIFQNYKIMHIAYLIGYIYLVVVVPSKIFHWLSEAGTASSAEQA